MMLVAGGGTLVQGFQSLQAAKQSNLKMRSVTCYLPATHGGSHDCLLPLQCSPLHHNARKLKSKEFLSIWNNVCTNATSLFHCRLSLTAISMFLQWNALIQQFIDPYPAVSCQAHTFSILASVWSEYGLD